jgi:hypothetical protein
MTLRKGTISPHKKLSQSSLVDRLNGGGRGEKLDKMIQKKKQELRAVQDEGIIDEFQEEDVL